MARGGHRYHLLLYSYTLNRLWKLALWIGILLLVSVAGLIELPVWLPMYHFSRLSEETLWIAGGVGAFAILAALFIAVIRKAAYVRPMPTHVRMVLPLFSMNISYKRIRHATSVEMQSLFPLERYKGWRQKYLQPLAGRTAVVLEMNGWPLPPRVLRMFLSPFFFPDKSPRLALLVTRWMDFSTEMESFRGSWLEAQRRPTRTPQSDLLASLAKPKR